ncbi:hypothetical protein HYW87_03805 [Candidatus Roizmanbacteria bacterium]|nr:hypothetical protein [Candidatus Roizmanbacteria bacterium]
MKVTIYTIPDCQYSNQEKDYLKSHNVVFEEKNLEANKDFLTEMLAISNNFAGTPVTKIEKDGGQSVVLKGFTKEEFDSTLGYSSAASAPAPSTSATPALSTALGPTPTTDQPAPPTPSVPNVIEPPAGTPAPQPPAQEPPTPQPPIPPNPPQNTPPPVAATPHVDAQLSDLLNQLQSKSSVGNTAPPSQASRSSSGGLPSIPEPNFG